MIKGLLKSSFIKIYTIYNNLSSIQNAIGKTAKTKIRNATYWSSTEYDESRAWSVYASDGYVDGNNKYTDYYVRAFLAL